MMSIENLPVELRNARDSMMRRIQWSLKTPTQRRHFAERNRMKALVWRHGRTGKLHYTKPCVANARSGLDEYTKACRDFGHVPVCLVSMRFE